MDPITLHRYVCLLSSVKSKERQEGETDTCLSRSVDTGPKISTSARGLYRQSFNFLTHAFLFMEKWIKGLLSKSHLSIVFRTTNGLTGKNQRSLEA